MTECLSKDLKIFILAIPNLKTNGLSEVVIHCSTMKDLQAALIKYQESSKIIACESNNLIGIDKLIMNNHIDTLYVFNNGTDEDIKEWLDSLIFVNIIEVNNEQQLMRRLSTKTMLCYYNQGLEYRRTGNHGLANICFLHSLHALNYSTMFI